MKKINVFLRLGKRPHPSVYEIIDNPPKGVEYKYFKILRSSKDKPSFFHQLKVKIWLRYIKNRPPIVRISPHGCQVIHMTNNILNSGKSPWVMDVENIWGLLSFDPSNLKKDYFFKVKKILLSKYCKKLLPYTNAARLSMINGGLEDLENKMEVVYLSKKSVKNFKKNINKIPTILWVGRRFYEKGGYTVLKVFDKLEGKYDFNLVMRGPVPKELKEKYKNKKNIQFLDTKDYVSDDIWENLYKKADIFLYPTNLDSFGNAFLDAMNYKIPIVTGDIFSSSEIVKNKVNGFVVDHPFKWHDENFKMIFPSFEDYIKKLKIFENDKYFSDLTKKVEILIKNPSLRRKMGEAGYMEVKKGKFSIEKRNKKLEKIYRDSIKS